MMARQVLLRRELCREVQPQGPEGSNGEFGLPSLSQHEAWRSKYLLPFVVGPGSKVRGLRARVRVHAVVAPGFGGQATAHD